MDWCAYLRPKLYEPDGEKMRAILLIFFSFVPALVLGDEPDIKPSYTQSYILIIKGTPAGSETVKETISPDGDLISTSEHEILLTDGLETNRMVFSTRMVFRDGENFPASYSYKHTTDNSGDSYEVLTRGTEITRTLNRGGNIDVATAQVTPDMILLDFDVYHHYDYLVRRYDNSTGGRQLFADFVPLLASDIPIALTLLGDSSLKFENLALQVKNYRVDFVGIWTGTLSVDENGRLVRLQLPAQDLEVVRRDLLP